MYCEGDQMTPGRTVWVCILGWLFVTGLLVLLFLPVLFVRQVTIVEYFTNVVLPPTLVLGVILIAIGLLHLKDLIASSKLRIISEALVLFVVLSPLLVAAALMFDGWGWIALGLATTLICFLVIVRRR
jgi:hypothetical protein